MELEAIPACIGCQAGVKRPESGVNLHLINEPSELLLCSIDAQMLFLNEINAFEYVCLSSTPIVTVPL